MTKIRSALVGFMLLFAGPVWAMEVYLKNGDRVTGDIVSQDDRVLRIKTAAAGEVVFDKTFIDGEKTYPPQGPPAAGPAPAGINVVNVVTQPPVQWSKTLSVAYTKALGNTRKNQAMGSLNINRRTTGHEATFKFDSQYSSSHDQLDARKFYGMLRYANSFGINLKSYAFYKLEGQQDPLANIDYRFVPSLGLGYWFVDNTDVKAMIELAAGYQYTNYSTSIKDEGQTVLVPRFYVDKRLIERLHFSEDMTVYPSLGRLGDLRYRSETAIINQINDRWAVKIQYISEFDSSPTAAAVKFDSTWITSLDYNF